MLYLSYSILTLPLMTKKSNAKMLKLYFGTYTENTKNKKDGTWVINDWNFENIIKNFKPIISNYNLMLGIWKKTGNYVDKLYEPIIIKDKELFAIYIERNNTNKKTLSFK